MNPEVKVTAHQDDDMRRHSQGGNADYDWTLFDSEAYFQHYYGEPHPDDDRVIGCAVQAVKRAAPAGVPLDIVDVGTGPNLIPLFCTLPRAKRLTAWEYAQSNVAWLEAEIGSTTLRPQWSHFWRVTREAYGPEWQLPQDPLPELRAKVTVKQGSIFDLPERRFDAATMFFCAESITAKFEEFEAACVSYARAVKPGGTLIAAFLVRSKGYIVADKPFPVLDVSEQSIQRVFAPYIVEPRTERIGIVEREIRSGYSGFVLLTGTAR